MAFEHSEGQLCSCNACDGMSALSLIRCRFSHAVTCPKGFRRAIVLLHGRRRSSISSDAPGPKGVRFASPELRFVPRQHLEAFDVVS